MDHPGPGHPDHHRRAEFVALIAALVGLVWAAQGLGAPIGNSFMIGDLRWTAAGLILVAVAGLYAWRAVRHSR